MAEDNDGISPEARLESLLLDAEPQDASEEEATSNGEAEATEETEEEQKDSEGEQGAEFDPDVLAKVLGLDANDLVIGDDGSVKFRTKIDGEVSEIDFAQLRKGYQIEAHANRKSMELSEARKQFDQQAAQLHEQFIDRINHASKIADFQKVQLEKEFKEVNWDELRRYDPTQFAIKRAEFDDRQKELNLLNEHISKEFEEQQKNYSSLRQKAIDEHLQKDFELLIQKDDSFNKPETWKALDDYLASQGLNEEYRKSLNGRHDLILLAKKAMLFDQGQKKIEVAKKKMIKVPTKALKPGAEAGSKPGDWQKILDSGRKKGSMSPAQLERMLLEMG